jgi:hypothetical protein
VDWPLVIAGALFVLWPVQYRHSIGRVRSKLEARGRDVERFDRRVQRLWISAMLVVVPILGVVLIVAGLTD